MSLRTRIFLLISVLFISVFTVFGLIRNAQVDKAVLGARNELEDSIKKIDQEKRDNILEFLMINVAAIDNRLGALFEKIEEYQWLRDKYAPTQYNYQTNDWASAAILMATNQWIDLIQTTAREKLTSLVIARPPYMNLSARIPVGDDLTIIIVSKLHSDYEAYIGVPYWVIGENGEVEGQKGMTNLSLNQDNFLLFSLDQILATDPNALKPQTLELPVSPLEPLIAIHSGDTYRQLLNATINAIGKTKEALLKNPKLIEILKSKEKTMEWAVKEGGVRLEDLAPEPFDKCSGVLCEELKAKHAESDWQQLEDWDQRYEQNQLIWKLGTLIGSGIWDYNPLKANSPKGITSFYIGELERKKDLIGKGLLSSDIFYGNALKTNSCIPPESDQSYNYCVAQRLQIFTTEGSLGVYLTKTMDMVQKDPKTGVKSNGTMTIGVDINPMLQMLALAAPSDILFISEKGRAISFDGKQVTEGREKWPQIEAKQLLDKKTGDVTNINGEEYLFIHMTAVAPDDNHVLVVDLKNNVYQMVNELNDKTEGLFHKLLVEYFFVVLISVAIVLIVLNHILKKAIAPIQHLAEVTKNVGSGDLNQIVISPKETERKDEVGVLCRSFLQMVEEMKQGEKIKAILHKVVPKEIADKILLEGINLEGETREVTVLFSDIRNFTEIAEKMEPQEVLHMLNDCLDLLSRVIDDYNGVIDKYVGDEIMALFGAPVDTENSALQAVLCAKMMRSVLGEWNEQRKERLLPILEIGIGIHTGSVVAGNVGGEKHLTYTILGHNVNLASRVSDVAGPMEILITEATFASPFVKEKIKCESLPPARFKGVSNPIALYRVL